MSKTNLFFKKCLSLIMSMMLFLTSFTLSGFVPTIEAEAATEFYKTGSYDFTSAISDRNTISGYTGNNFVMRAKAWDSGLGVQDNTLSYIDNTFNCVLRVNENQTTNVSYNGGTTSVTPGVSGLYVQDGLVYINNINEYLNNYGFKISWTQQYFSKSSASGAGVFSLGTTNNGDVVKWTTSDNKLYISGSEVLSVAPVSGTVYDITLTMNTDKKINVLVKNHSTNTSVIDYTTSGTYEPTSLNYLVIGSCDQGSNSLGTLALSRLSIEKSYDTSNPLAEYTDTINYVKANIESFNGYTGNASAPADNSFNKNNLLVDSSLGINDKMSNVLYSAGTTNEPWSNSTVDIIAAMTKNWIGSKTYYYVKTGLQYGNMAFLYDGQNECANVIMSYSKTTASEGGMQLLEPTTSEFSIKSNWHSSQTLNSKDYSGKYYVFGNATGETKYARTQSETEAYFYNTLYYTGTPSQTVTTVTDIEYKCTIHSEGPNGSSYDGNTGTITFGTTNTKNGPVTIYIVNYKPIKSKVSTIKSIYDKVKTAGDSAYCADSLGLYYKAVEKVLKLDPNNYAYSTDLSNSVTSLGNDIDNVVNNYLSTATTEPVKHSNKTTIENVIDSTCTDPGSYVEVDTCILCNKTSRNQKTTAPLGHNYGSATKTTTTDSENRTLQVHQKTCSRCNEVLTEYHNLVLNGTTASCSECDYSVEDSYTSNDFRITKGNLFDFDAYADNQNSTQISGNKGTSIVDKVNDTITVVGNKYDAYTDHGARDLYYRIAVNSEKTYTLSYVPSTSDNQAYVFFSDGESYFPTNSYWCKNNYGAVPNTECKIIFTLPEKCTYVDFRFGTVNSGAICTFSDISFYESDEYGNPTNGYEVLKSGLTKGAKVLESLSIPNAEKCNASYAMSNKNGLIKSSDTIDTNLNISLDTKHVYGEFINDYANGSAYNKNTIYTHSKTCTDCSFKLTENCTFNNTGINDGKATVQCSVCGGNYTLDYSAYNSELAVLDGMLTQTNKYSNTETCKTERDSVNNSATTGILTQAAVDAKVEELNAIEKKLTLATYTVTFSYVIDGVDGVNNVNGYPIAYKYGELANLSTTGMPENTIPYKWTYTVGNDGQEILLAKTTTSASVIVTGNINVTVYLAKDEAQTEESTTVRVNLYDKSKRLIGVAYTTGSTITFSDTEVNANGTTLSPTRIPFYNAKGFIVDGTIYSSSNQTYAIPDGKKVVDVYTNYEVESKIKITVPSDVKLNGNTVSTSYYEATWNEMITLTSDSEVDWYANDVLVGKGTTYAFRANADVTITVEAAQQNVSPSTSIGYFDYDKALNRVSVVNNFYAPNAREAGVILSTKYRTVEDVKKYGQKFGVTNDKFTENKNQVRISVSRKATTSFTMYAVSYVVAEDGQTYYSNAVTVCEYVAQ